MDVSVNIDPIEPPAAFRRVVVGEEFNEADTVLPRPFSTVDVGHFLNVMQVRSSCTATFGDGGGGVDRIFWKGLNLSRSSFSVDGITITITITQAEVVECPYPDISVFYLLPKCFRSQ